jgi:hypothetical protein
MLMHSFATVKPEQILQGDKMTYFGRAPEALPVGKR